MTVFYCNHHTSPGQKQDAHGVGVIGKSLGLVVTGQEHIHAHTEQDQETLPKNHKIKQNKIPGAGTKYSEQTTHILPYLLQQNYCDAKVAGGLVLHPMPFAPFSTNSTYKRYVCK